MKSDTVATVSTLAIMKSDTVGDGTDVKICRLLTLAWVFLLM